MLLHICFHSQGKGKRSLSSQRTVSSYSALKVEFFVSATGLGLVFCKHPRYFNCLDDVVRMSASNVVGCWLIPRPHRIEGLLKRYPQGLA